MPIESYPHTRADHKLDSEAETTPAHAHLLPSRPPSPHSTPRLSVAAACMDEDMLADRNYYLIMLHLLRRADASFLLRSLAPLATTTHLSDRGDGLVRRALARDVSLLLALVARLRPQGRSANSDSSNARRGSARAGEVVQLAALVAADDAGGTAGEAAAGTDEGATGGREGGTGGGRKGNAGGTDGAGAEGDGDLAGDEGSAGEGERRERVLEGDSSDGRAQAGDVAKVACRGGQESVHCWTKQLMGEIVG